MFIADAMAQPRKGGGSQTNYAAVLRHADQIVLTEDVIPKREWIFPGSDDI